MQLVSDSAPAGPEDLSSTARAREPEYLVHSFRLDRGDSAREPSKSICPMRTQAFGPSWNRTSRSGARRDGGNRQVDAILRRLERQLKAAQTRKRRSCRLKVPAASSDNRTSRRTQMWNSLACWGVAPLSHLYITADCRAVLSSESCSGQVEFTQTVTAVRSAPFCDGRHNSNHRMVIPMSWRITNNGVVLFSSFPVERLFFKENDYPLDA